MKKRKEKEFKIRTYLTGIIWLALACSMIISALLFAFLKHFLEMPENIPAIVWLLIFNTMIAGLITVLLNGKVLEPITKLSEAMKDVSQGDFDKQLETSSRIAEVAQSYNSFNVMTKELRATQILQMDFVSNVSHEFKTPINAIEGYTMLLQGEELSNEQNEYVEKILKRFGESKEINWIVTGIVLLEDTKGESQWNGIPVFGETDDYLEYATQHVVDEVFIQVDEIQKRESCLKNIILEFEKMGVVVNLNLDLFDLGINGVKQVYSLERYNVLAFSSRLFDYRMVCIKRMIDITGALVGLLFTGIIGIVLAPFLLIESPGPLIFCQNRVGVNGRIFKFYKFRSMCPNAEAKLDDLLDQNEMDGPVFKIKDDPRITRVGKFIRKTSLDELPQLWNILKGDMSIVGPRPALPREVEQYGDYEKQRLYVTPGLSCYWQIAPHRNDLSFEEWMDLDVKYVKERSFWVDWKIIFKTFKVCLLGRGE